MSEQNLSAVAWIEKLPNAGGDWGRGVIGTVRALETQINELNNQKASLDQQLDQFAAKVKADKAERTATIKTKQKLIAKTIKRAQKEVSTLFGNSQIEQAQQFAASHSDSEAEATS